MLKPDRRKGAVFDVDREYRYGLWRTWDVDKPVVVWVMLNPSTADEEELDPTLRRCRDYSKRWGYGKMWIGNLFAVRSPDPSILKEHDEPVGPENDDLLNRMAEHADLIMVAWGAHGNYQDRDQEVLDLLGEHDRPHCLGWTQDGLPVHPLYQPKTREPHDYRNGMR